MSTVKTPKVEKPKTAKAEKPFVKKLITFHDSYETTFLGGRASMTATLKPKGVEMSSAGITELIPLELMGRIETVSARHLKEGIVSDTVLGNKIVAYVGQDGLCYQETASTV